MDYTRASTRPDLRPLVVMQEVNVTTKLALGLDLRGSEYRVDLSAASSGILTYPKVGSRWYIAKIGDRWVLSSRFGDQNPALGIVGTPGSQIFDGDIVTNGNVRLTDGTKQVNVGGSGSGASFAALRTATTDPILSGRVGADTNSRFFIRASGEMIWGNGTITDISIARAGNNTLLASDVNIIIQRTGSTSAVFGAQVTGDDVARLAITADGDFQWSDGTTTNFRLERLDTDDLQLQDARFRVRRTNDTDLAFGAYVTGDSQTRWHVNAKGSMTWSDGSASADTNLYRFAPNVLKTDDQLTVDGGIDAPDHAPVTNTNNTDDAGFSHTTYQTNQQCGLTFVAPPSGSVIILFKVRMESNTAAVRVLASVDLKTGSTIGSGTNVLTESDSNAIESAGQERTQAGQYRVATGLTPGDSYNTRILYKLSGAGTGDIFDQSVSVLPWIG